MLGNMLSEGYEASSFEGYRKELGYIRGENCLQRILIMLNYFKQNKIVMHKIYCKIIGGKMVCMHL